jgi:hypothetical protein
VTVILPQSFALFWTDLTPLRTGQANERKEKQNGSRREDHMFYLFVGEYSIRMVAPGEIFGIGMEHA